MSDRGEASDFTRAINDELLGYLPFEDRQDFEDAARGHIADLNGTVVKAPDGRVVWDPNKFSFIADDAPAPASVNPSLWRQSQLCARGVCSRSSIGSTRSAITTPDDRRGRYRPDPV